MIASRAIFGEIFLPAGFGEICLVQVSNNPSSYLLVKSVASVQFMGNSFGSAEVLLNILNPSNQPLEENIAIIFMREKF